MRWTDDLVTIEEKSNVNGIRLEERAIGERGGIGTDLQFAMGE